MTYFKNFRSIKMDQSVINQVNELKHIVIIYVYMKISYSSNTEHKRNRGYFCWKCRILLRPKIIYWIANKIRDRRLWLIFPCLICQVNSELQLATLCKLSCYTFKECSSETGNTLATTLRYFLDSKKSEPYWQITHHGTAT